MKMKSKGYFYCVKIEKSMCLQKTNDLVYTAEVFHDQSILSGLFLIKDIYWSS